MKKRTDSKEACNQNHEDEDRHIRLKIMEQVGCIPVYWKQFHTNEENLADCENTEQLKNMVHEIKRYRKWMNSYDPPCEEMTAIFAVFHNAGLLCLSRVPIIVRKQIKCKLYCGVFLLFM